MNFNLVQYFKDGGPFMYVLLLLSVVAFTFMIERIVMIIIIKKKLSPAELMNKMEELFKSEGDNKAAVVEKLLAFCRERGGPVSEVMIEGLTKYQETANYDMNIMEAKEWINKAIEEKGAVEVPTMEKHLSVISTVAMVSPLCGLLGTVTGMIVAFNVMASSAGGAKPDELAGGISQALITTATGLIIAIPALIVYNFLRSTVDNMVLEMEEVAILMTDKLIQK